MFVFGEFSKLQHKLMIIFLSTYRSTNQKLADFAGFCFHSVTLVASWQSPKKLENCSSLLDKVKASL